MKLEDKKRMAAKAFAVFFLFMAAAGGLSRAAAAMTVPLADTGGKTEPGSDGNRGGRGKGGNTGVSG